MSKNPIKISLTEFLNFVNKSGSAKSTVVSIAKNKREEEYKFFQDYWNPLKIKIKSVHRKRGTHDDLKELLEQVEAGFRPQMNAKEQKFSITTNQISHNWLIGDNVRVLQILNNSS